MHGAPISHPQQPENVLLSQNKSGFKLIDFGSATTVAVTPGADLPVAIVDEELEKYTTMQVWLLCAVCLW